MFPHQNSFLSFISFINPITLAMSLSKSQLLAMAAKTLQSAQGKFSKKMGKTYNTNSADMALVSSDDKLFFVHLARIESVW